VNLFLDTHFLLWIVTGSPRLREFPWLARYQPWGVSPVSFLEIQFLSEVGRLQVRNPEFTQTVSEDARFLVDDASIVTLIHAAIPLTWTRDPFDRLLCAHSSCRRVPLCTTDAVIRQNHSLLPAELKG
jgi:PIN domain nuclease of toxin-antitoxin system